MSDLNLNWPPEDTFKYEFKGKEQMDLEIPLFENKKKAKKKDEKDEPEKDIK